MHLIHHIGFHDCVGGCNGCINFNNPDNNGLSKAVSTLSNLYTRNNFQSYGATLADFWAMAASVAVSAAVRTSNSQRNNGQSCTSQSCPGPWVLYIDLPIIKILKMSHNIHPFSETELLVKKLKFKKDYSSKQVSCSMHVPELGQGYCCNLHRWACSYITHYECICHVQLLSAAIRILPSSGFALNHI